MKIMRILILSLLLLFSVHQLQAKEKPLKAEFKVNGNCDECKERIEKAAKFNGVKSASWDKETHVMTVKYLPSKTNVSDIEQHIAEAGYDTQDVVAKDDAYQALPKCCQYQR